MSEADDAFVQATDNLISLYRSVERRTLDLPLVSFMPFLLFFWATIKFVFFLYLGIFIILPVNLVILVRTFSPDIGVTDRFSYLTYIMYGSGYGEAKYLRHHLYLLDPCLTSL
jgi:hypothetical protein